MSCKTCGQDLTPGCGSHMFTCLMRIMLQNESINTAELSLNNLALYRIPCLTLRTGKKKSPIT
ncbi:hypothetical protein J6590_059117 [Homalodisca vitripennis]|nr:hypothetical protein J6590_059117 [Homalodisca vitripennis]